MGSYFSIGQLFLFGFSVFVFSVTLHPTPQCSDISKSRTFFDLSSYSKPQVFCCGRREKIPGFLEEESWRSGYIF